MPRLLSPAGTTSSNGPPSSGKSPISRRNRAATSNGKFNGSANGYGRAITKLGKNKNSSSRYSVRQILRVLQFIILPGLFLVMLAAAFHVKTLVVNDTSSKAGDNQNNLRDVRQQNQPKAADNSNQEITKKVEQAKLRASGPIDKLITEKGVDHGEKEAEYLGNYVPLIKPAANHVKPGSVEHFYTERQRPQDKIVYFLHIHKSGGTALCNMARFNELSTSATNCNVQRDQRCCGNEDTLEAQRSYANRTRYDFVASEGRMYDSMDPSLYAYILVLRNSLNRYYSHWKHVKLTYRQLPSSMRLEDEPELEAAGGAPPLLGHVQAHVVDSQDGDRHDQMMDLVRHSKEKRAAARQQKMAEMEEWKRQAALAGEEAKKHPMQHHQQQRNVTVTNDGGPKPTPKPLDMEDLTMKTNKNMYFPHRRLIEFTTSSNHRRKLTVENVAGEKSEKDTKRKAPVHLHMMPHPADGPEHAFSSNGPPKDYKMPLFGRTFAEWWTRQPDNWNFRQLCGNHCAGIPKYQLTMDDWAYTISRLLQFESVLFIEDFQSSLDVLASRRGWKESSIEALNAFIEKEAVRKAMERDKHSHNGAASGGADAHGNIKEFYRGKKKEAPEDDPRFKKQQLREWDPLMAALDDALYDIAKRWEALKQQKGTTSLAAQELGSLVNIFALPQEVQDIFQVYMDEGDHRVQCENECCAKRCSAW